MEDMYGGASLFQVHTRLWITVKVVISGVGSYVLRRIGEVRGNDGMVRGRGSEREADEEGRLRGMEEKRVSDGTRREGSERKQRGSKRRGGDGAVGEEWKSRDEKVSVKERESEE